MTYSIVYWNSLKNDGVKVRKFDNKKDGDDFLVNNKNEYKEFIICEYKGEKNGVAQYRVLNRGTSNLFKFLAYIVSLTVMVAIIAAFWYFRSRLILIK